MGVLDKFTFTQESKDEKTGADNGDVEVIDANHADFDRGFVTENNDQLQRRLGNRQIQLLAIGGSIGMSNTSYFPQLRAHSHIFSFFLQALHSSSLSALVSPMAVQGLCSSPTPYNALSLGLSTTASPR